MQNVENHREITMRWILLMVVAGMLVGCGASMVMTSETIGGVQNGPKWGIIKYLNNGADGVIASRQGNARRQMAGYCRPINYKVIQTTSNPTSAFFISGSLAGGITGGGGSFDYVYLKFECVE